MIVIICNILLQNVTIFINKVFIVLSKIIKDMSLYYLKNSYSWVCET